VLTLAQALRHSGIVGMTREASCHLKKSIFQVQTLSLCSPPLLSLHLTLLTPPPSHTPHSSRHSPPLSPSPPSSPPLPPSLPPPCHSWEVKREGGEKARLRSWDKDSGIASGGADTPGLQRAHIACMPQGCRYSLLVSHCTRRRVVRPVPGELPPNYREKWMSITI